MGYSGFGKIKEIKMGSVGLYFKFSTQVGIDCHFRVAAYRFEGCEEVKGHSRVAPENKVSVLKCKCGSFDWSENGRFINEYECSGCGRFIEVYCHTSNS